MIENLESKDVLDLFTLQYLRRDLLRSEHQTIYKFHRLVQEQVYNLEAEEQYIHARLRELQRKKAALQRP